ncbi:beta-ketoacyl synthase chain length factor [Marinimicrobium sp. ARAG 43.8]|uniref:beta-ketoacyl synthase chain length factor n=1 Tax=Marinimicrobium sp. ARAG 43.8 TaxID=3418719 RepID=UPI003CE87761
MDLFVSRLAAWAPGLTREQEWRAWAAAPTAVLGDDKPKPAAVPAMLRRRLTRWSRMALEVATSVDEWITADTPVIFSSRHGDTHCTEALLRSLADGEALSPTAFSLSVHNAAVGVYTIVRKITAPSLAIAAGRATLPQAWLEAQSWLLTGTPEVLLVHVDEPLSAFYQPYEDESEMPAAVAMVLQARPSENAMRTSLRVVPPQGRCTERSVMMQFLAWWYGPHRSLALDTGQQGWIWERDVELD